MNQDFLNKIFKLCEISDADARLLTDRLFKYKDDYVVNATCSVINSLQSHISRFYELWQEVGLLPFPIESTKPLIILSPDNITSLRIYPNIIINGGINSAVSSITCNDILKDFLSAYEADLLDENKSKKWQSPNIDKRLQEYIDMPTARAISRYMCMCTDNNYRDDQIRDFADALDNLRKPMELSFADTPEDFFVMYGSGPHSCMAHNAEGKSSWKFLLDLGLCPASWYAYYPYTRGCFVLKNKKVIARAVLFLHNDKWSYGRVYANNAEIEKKFKQSLAENNIPPISNSIVTPPAGTKFTIPGIKISNGYACPWPYFDNLGREGRDWGIAFDDKTKEFTIETKPTKLPGPYVRGGHLNSMDYRTIICENCDSHISLKDNPIIPTEGADVSFCSIKCANESGYVLKINGVGTQVYSKRDEFMIPVLNEAVVFSTLRAAEDNGFYRILHDDLIPEDTALVVSKRIFRRITALDGSTYGNPVGGGYHDDIHLSFNNVPIKLNSTRKLVEFNAEEIMLGV